MNLINKRAQIGDTLTWILAALLVFFIMFFFIAITSLLAAKEKISISRISVKEETIKPISDIIVTENFINFLNTKSDGWRVYDLASEIGNENLKKEKVEAFKKEAGEFLDKLGVGLGKDKKYARAWIRIYEKGEKIQQYPIGKYVKDYEIIKFEGPLYCDPLSLNTNSAVFDIFIPENKKIVLCTEQNANYKK